MESFIAAITQALAEPAFLLICGIVFFAFLTQAATGFGAMLIAMTLGALLYPVDLLLTWFVPQVVFLSAYMLIRDRSKIAWPLLLKLILPAMFGGLLVGQWLFYSLNTDWLKTALGMIVVLLALRELLRKAESQSKPPLLPWTLAAGVVHGIFATGGPLLVYALNGQKLDKTTFRNSLLMVWGLFGIVLLISYLSSGKLSTSTLPQISILAAILPLSIIVGGWLHHRIDPATFQRVINVMLVISGLALIFG